MCRLVGQDSINIAVAQACLVEAHIRSEILGIQHVFFGMLQLNPIAVAAYLLFVLLSQRLAFESVARRKCGYADWGALNLLLLKKPRTRR